MCFKENASMTTIESTPLNGGACNGKYTVNDMKAKGWSVDDIKISQTANGMNFIYILKLHLLFKLHQLLQEIKLIWKLEL